MATPLALRSLEYWAFQYKRTWRGSVVTSVLTPVLFLAAMGVGLGTFVKGGARSSLDGVSYLDFLAPGLLAAAAMQTGVGESTWPVMAAVKWVRTYHAMLATPLRVVDVLVGHLTWIVLRVAMVAAVFLAVMAGFGAVGSWTAVLAWPAAVLTGVAFAAPVVAFAARQENDAAFAWLNRFVVIPLFLFSGTFFPVSQLPAWAHPVAYVTPLWHGVDLCRALVLGHVSPWPVVGHVAYLGALTAVGVAAALRSYRNRLRR